MLGKDAFVKGLALGKERPSAKKLVERSSAKKGPRQRKALGKIRRSHVEISEFWTYDVATYSKTIEFFTISYTCVI